MINFQRSAFPDLTSFCCKHLFTMLLSQFRAVYSYGTRNTRTGKQNYFKLSFTNFILFGLFRIHLQLSFGHMLTLIPHIEIYFTFAFLDCARYNEYFAKSRFVISRFCSIPFIVILARLKKIVIPRTSLYRGSLNRGSTVFMKYKNITKLPQT